AVMPNPYFSDTDSNGTAKIENVPPGKYKVQAWHETLGKQEKEVEVKAGQTAKVAFEMKKQSRKDRPQHAQLVVARERLVIRSGDRLVVPPDLRDHGDHRGPRVRDH